MLIFTFVLFANFQCAKTSVLVFSKFDFEFNYRKEKVSSLLCIATFFYVHFDTILLVIHYS